MAFADLTYGFYSVFADLYGIDAKIIPLDSDFSISPEDYIGLDRGAVIANPNAPTGKALPLSEIERIGFDYAALGHIHNRAEKEDSDGRVRYCGFAEGRSFDELGVGGVWLIDIDGDRCEVSRKPISSRAFYICELDVSDISTNSALVDALCDIVSAYAGSGGAHIRISLCGRADEQIADNAVLAIPQVIARSGAEYIEIIDDTMPAIDGEYLARDTTLRGELYRTLLPKLRSEDGTERRLATKALRIGLAAIDGKSIFGVSE